MTRRAQRMTIVAGVGVASALAGATLADPGVTTTPAPTPMAKLGSDCTLKGHRLYGKVKVVTAFPDLKVKVVTAFPDLKVKTVTAFPDACGLWQMVDSFPDVTIQYVDAFPDLTIERVTAFPGVP
ncbi:MAG: hypothetical protein R3B06_09320 [Kofleriaceae bacterium]